jgi:hypothetical protein
MPFRLLAAGLPILWHVIYLDLQLVSLEARNALCQFLSFRVACTKLIINQDNILHQFYHSSNKLYSRKTEICTV